MNLATNNSNSAIPLGTLIQKVQIGNTSINVYSNGRSDFVNEEKSYDKEGNYLGIRYQCVEFVRRYIYKRDNINLALYYSEGNADAWYKNKKAMKLKDVTLKEVQIGDILCFRGGHTGHIAIVSNIDEKNIYMTSQNLYNTKEEIHFPLEKKAFFKKDIQLKNQIGEINILEGVLRVLPTNNC